MKQNLIYFILLILWISFSNYYEPSNLGKEYYEGYGYGILYSIGVWVCYMASELFGE